MLVEILFPFLVHVPLLGYLLWQWYKAQTNTPLKQWFWPAIGIKLLSGSMLGVLYLYYYPYNGDTWTIFEESARLSKLAFRSPFDYMHVLSLEKVAYSQYYVVLDLYEQPRALFMAKLLSVINLFTFHNYWITGAYCSLFSFWSLWKLVNQLVRYFPATRLAAGMGFLFFPSVVFWSSGILKEAIAVGCICSMVQICLSVVHEIGINGIKWKFLLKRNTLVNAVAGGVAFYVLWQIKFYYAGILVLALGSYVVAVLGYVVFETTSLWIMRCLHLLVYIGILNLVPLGYSFLTGHSLLESIVQNHDATLRGSEPGTYIIFSLLEPASTSFLQHFPLALWSGLFAPMPWQVHNGLALSVSLENSLLLILMAGYILSLFRRQNYILNSEKSSVLYLLLEQSMGLYVLSLAVILALASPNFGALARYKVGYLPFLLYFTISRIINLKILKSNCTHANT